VGVKGAEQEEQHGGAGEGSQENEAPSSHSIPQVRQPNHPAERTARAAKLTALRSRSGCGKPFRLER
jgi:hypothetical protein